MIDLLTIEKQFIAPHVKKGGTAVDFTMGNGHDTKWISDAVGPKGKVYAFDIQEQALESTRKLLKESGCAENYELILDSHANVKKYVTGPICAGMFNLGYLPGGDKSVTTLRPSTLEAVKAAIELLDHDGGLLIAVYPGHAEGTLEGEMLTEYLSSLSRFQICCSKFRIINSPTSPFFFLVEKK